MAQSTEVALRKPEGDPPEEEEQEQEHEAPGRDADLLGTRGNTRLRQKLKKLHDQIAQGFVDQIDRTNDQIDCWACYHCSHDEHQYYNGTSQIYVPIIRDAINARATRFVNQLFPRSGRYVEVSSTDGTDEPYGIIALVDNYIRMAKLKTDVARTLSINGDVEGQYNVYVDWKTITREVVSRETHGVEVDDIEMPGEDVTTAKTETVKVARPSVEVLHDGDVLVLPASAESVEDALEQGGVVAIVRRWTKSKLMQMAEEGHIRQEEADEIGKQMDAGSNDTSSGASNDTAKELREYAGIKQKGGHVVVWEYWHKFPVKNGKIPEKGTKLICKGYMTSGSAGDMQLGLKRNPNWNDKCQLLSWPVVKQAGAFKGQSLVLPIASLQYEANDAVNEAADAATLSAAPIVARDPTKTTSNLVYNMGAVWDVAPSDVQLMSFPDLTPRGMTRVQYCQQAIFQSLGVNPAMIPQQTGRVGQRRNQAEVAMEQQVDLLTTAEAVSVQEEGGYTPIVEWFVDLDHQYREDPIMLRMHGKVGVRAVMQEIGPIQNSTHFTFTWWGVEQARTAANQQQMIAWLNIARGMEAPLKAAGYRLNPAPPLIQSAQTTFDSRIAPLVIVDEREELAVPAGLENMLLMDGHDLNPHAMDNHPRHLQEHFQAQQESGDPHGTIRIHLQRHIQMMQLQQAAMMNMQMQQRAGRGNPGVPGGAGPGVPGAPRGGQLTRIGAQPRGPQQMKRPPGSIHPDELPAAGSVVMPRE